MAKYGIVPLRQLIVIKTDSFLCFNKLNSLLRFLAYEDADDDLKLSSNHMPYCLDDLSFNVPLCVPDPADPTKIPCYNKTQVKQYFLTIKKNSILICLTKKMFF